MHTILIVDDDESMLRILELIFRRGNYKVITTRSGDEALKVLQHCTPDIVVLDDMMPGLSGAQVCQSIKSAEATRTIPVVLHSAGSDILEPGYLKRIGADSALQKPCEPRHLLETVGDYVGAVAY